MKRIILTLSLFLLTLSAGAWNKLSQGTIMTLAANHLTAEAAKATKQVLGENFADCSIEEKANHLLILDENYAPLGTNEDDALVVAKKCVERINQNPKDGEAILLLAKAVADMHNVPNVRIKGKEFSYKDFAVRRWNNREGRMARYTHTSWHFVWNIYYASRHRIFTPDLYAEDMEICHGNEYNKFSVGTLDEWAADMGRECRSVYAKEYTDNQIFRQEEINIFEFIHDRLMVKAGYRLASILNNLYK